MKLGAENTCLMNNIDHTLGVFIAKDADGQNALWQTPHNFFDPLRCNLSGRRRKDKTECIGTQSNGKKRILLVCYAAYFDEHSDSQIAESF